MRLSQINLSVIVEEYQDDDTPIHAADNVYHRLYKQRGTKRSSRKNHKDLRTVTYTLPDEKSMAQFMLDVQKEFAKLANES